MVTNNCLPLAIFATPAHGFAYWQNIAATVKKHNKRPAALVVLFDLIISFARTFFES